MTPQTRVPVLSATRGMAPVRGAKWLLYSRLVVAVFILAYLLLSSGGWGQTWTTKTVYGIIVVVVALNAVYLLLLRRLADVAAFSAVQIGIDVAIVALLVLLTGGVLSQMIVLHLLLIIAAALVLSWKAAVAFSAEAAALHLVVVMIGTFGVVAAPVPVRQALSSLFVQLLGFFAVAVLSGLLARRLSLARLLSHEILEAIGQGLIIADPRERILLMNAEARRLLGDHAAAAERHLADVFPGEVWGRMRVDPVTGLGAIREVELDTPRDGRVPVSVAVRPVPAEGAEPLGTIAIITDRTLARRFEDAMMHAQRSEAVSEMAAAIAHEIRNPLAAMRGAVQEIARRLKKLGDAAPPDSDGLLEIVLSESDRLDAIITDFLAFARMRPASRADVNVCAVIKEAVVMLEQAAAERGRTDVAIRASCTEELRCRIDAMQFRQVLLNLGLNSIDAVAGRSGAEITLRAEKRAFLDFAAGSEDRLIGRSDPVAGEQIGVAICVEDNGCGMSEDKRRRATEPFFTTKERGTGLGLSVVERVVKAHDGLVRIDSQEGRGTSVHIWVASEG